LNAHFWAFVNGKGNANGEEKARHSLSEVPREGRGVMEG